MCEPSSPTECMLTWLWEEMPMDAGRGKASWGQQRPLCPGPQATVVLKAQLVVKILSYS